MRIGVTGYKGRMGQMLLQEIEGHETLEYAGGTEEGDDPTSLFQNSDCVIDFTIPKATREHIRLAAKHQTTLVIGTTGLTQEDEKEIENAAKETTIVYAANMSVGVNMILALIEQAAARLGPEWDIEIAETHHKHKIDSPSGTALALGKSARSGRGSGDFVTDRNGKRNKGDIGFGVQRGGDIVGEHTLTFFGEGERVEIAHKATDRGIYARGALRAALWTKGQPHGLYSMRDILGL